MKVKAAPGIKVPKEGKPREYITEADQVEVPHSAYYLRIVAEGDLIVLEGQADAGVADPVSVLTDGAKKTIAERIKDPHAEKKEGE